MPTLGHLIRGNIGLTLPSSSSAKTSPSPGRGNGNVAAGQLVNLASGKMTLAEQAANGGGTTNATVSYDTSTTVLQTGTGLLIAEHFLAPRGWPLEHTANSSSAQLGLLLFAREFLERQVDCLSALRTAGHGLGELHVGDAGGEIR